MTVGHRWRAISVKQCGRIMRWFQCWLRSASCVLSHELTEKPCPGHGPFSLDRANGDAKKFGGLFRSEAAKEAHFNDFLLARVHGMQLFERFIDGEQLLLGVYFKCEGIVPGTRSMSASALGAESGTGVVDQDSAHQLCRHGHEVGAVLEACSVLLDELEISLMNEGGRLQGVADALVPHVRGGTPMQLVVDQRHQAGNNGLVAPGKLVQQGCNFSW